MFVLFCALINNNKNVISPVLRCQHGYHSKAYKTAKFVSPFTRINGHKQTLARCDILNRAVSLTLQLPNRLNIDLFDNYSISAIGMTQA